MDSKDAQQMDSKGADIASTIETVKGPEDLVIVQIKVKSREALKTLKKYKRETNAEILERVIDAAIAVAKAGQSAPA